MRIWPELLGKHILRYALHYVTRYSGCQVNSCPLSIGQSGPVCQSEPPSKLQADFSANKPLISHSLADIRQADYR